VAKAQREAGSYRALIIPLGVVAIVIMLVVPLPTWVLDLLITTDITGAIKKKKKK
jgi:flagellar biosynthesis protein FlhA